MVSLDYTADEILAAIRSALVARDMPAVASLTRMLAVKDPSTAEGLVLWVDWLNRTEAAR